jgi:hypothetical protein
MQLQLRVLIASGVALLLLAWFFRFEIVPASDKNIAAFKLDRWTGTVTLLAGTEELRIELEE